MQQTVTTACHHCVDPACLKGCPVDAYEKDPVTGIVTPPRRSVHRLPVLHAHLSVRGAAVQRASAASSASATCAAAGSPKARRPRACRRVRTTRSRSASSTRDKVLEDAQGDAFLPGAPSPGITVPTTDVQDEGALPRNLLPADFYSRAARAPAHAARGDARADAAVGRARSCVDRAAAAVARRDPRSPRCGRCRRWSALVLGLLALARQHVAPRPAALRVPRGARPAHVVDEPRDPGVRRVRRGSRRA